MNAFATLRRSLLLSAALLTLLPPLPVRAAADIAASPATAHPLAVGARVPDAAIKAMDGTDASLATLLAGKPTVLIVFRGGWCPYCTQHLAELAEAEPKLMELGFQIVALSTDQPKNIRFLTEEKHLPYRLFSDRDMHASSALGLAYRIDAAMQKKYAEWGIDLPAIPGDAAARWLPVPAAFVIARDGTVRFAHADPDYKVRVSGEKLLAAARDAAR